MGTRADFWVRGRNRSMMWMGSIAWDGYPDMPNGIEKNVQFAKTLKIFKKELNKFFENRDDVTYPKEGWPWPWETSNTTDYAYVFDNRTERVYIVGYGGRTYTTEENRRYDKYKARVKKHNEKCTYGTDEVWEELGVEEWLEKNGKCELTITFPDMTIVPENIFRAGKSGIMVLGSK